MNAKGAAGDEGARQALVPSLDFEKKLSLKKIITFSINWHIGGLSPSWVHSARRPLNGLLYLPRVIMMRENLVE
jgi:hypothetical protein